MGCIKLLSTKLRSSRLWHCVVFRSTPMFWRTLLPPSSDHPPTHWYPTTSLHGVTT